MSTTLIIGSEAELAYEAAQRVVRTHERLVEFMRAGQTLAQIDAEVAKILADLSCRSCFIGYRIPRMPAFPSHACLSVNECVVHGTAGYLTRPMRAGDVLKVDIGVIYKGFVGDAAWTYSFGTPEPMIRRLMDCGKEALKRGIEQLRTDRPYISWARAVQKHVEEEERFHLVRGLGGHGYGRWNERTKSGLHGAPFISNTVPVTAGEWPEASVRPKPGTLVAVEPMIAVGTGRTQQRDKQWPVFTADGSMSVHHEHDVLITAEGPRVLTEGMERLADVIG